MCSDVFDAREGSTESQTVRTSGETLKTIGGGQGDGVLRNEIIPRYRRKLMKSMGEMPCQFRQWPQPSATVAK